MRSLDDNASDTQSSDQSGDQSGDQRALEAGSTGSPAPARRGEVTPTPWTFRQMVIGVTATLIPWLTFSVGSLALFGSSTPTAKPPSVTIDAISGVVVFLVSALLEAIFLIAPLLVVFSRKLPRAPFRERMRWLGFRSTPLAPALLVIVVGLVIGLGGSVLYSQLVAILHLPLQTNTDTLLQEGKSAPLTTLGILAAAAFVAPVCEEIFFRGLLFTGLLKRMSLWPSVVLSAIIFGVSHADVGSLVPLIIIGLALAWARWRTDSLWPGIIIHTVNNTAAAVVLLPLLLK